MEVQGKMLETGSAGSENPQQLPSNNVGNACNEDLKSSETRSDSQSHPSSGDASEGGICNETTALGVANDVGAGGGGGNATDRTKTAPVATEGVGNESGNSPINGGSDCIKTEPGVADACKGGAQVEDGEMRIATAPTAAGGGGPGGDSNGGFQIDLNAAVETDIVDNEQASLEEKDGAGEGSCDVAGGAGDVAADGGGKVAVGVELLPARKRMKFRRDGDEPPAMHEEEEEEVAGSASEGGESNGGGGDVEPPMQQPKYGIRLFGYDI